MKIQRLLLFFDFQCQRRKREEMVENGGKMNIGQFSFEYKIIYYLLRQHKRRLIALNESIKQNI